MADREELQVVLTTIANNRGATQARDALRQVRQEAQQTQAAINSPRAQFANDLVRQLTQAHGGTLEAFTRAQSTVASSTGVASTLTPADLGIVERATTQAAGATKILTGAVREHTQAQTDNERQVNISGTSILRFGTALFGVSAGLSLFTTAGHLVQQAITGIVATEVNAQRATRELTAAYGAASADFQRFATETSKTKEAFGVPDIEQATLALRPLGEQYRFTRGQLQDLVIAATKLADLHEIPLADAAKILDAAIRGSSQAADQLGLSLSDVQVAQRAFGGGLAGTFPALNEQQKALLRLTVALQEIDQAQKNAAGTTEPLSRGERAVTTALEDLIRAGSGASILTIATGLFGEAAKALNLFGVGAFNAQKPVKELNFDLGAMAQVSGVELAKVPTAVDEVKTSLESLGRAGPPTPTIARFLGDLAEEAGRAQQRLGELQGVMLNVADAGGQLASTTAQSRAEVALLAAEQANQSPGGLKNQLAVALQQAQTDAERQQIQVRLDGLQQLEGAFGRLGEAERIHANIQREGIILNAQSAQAQLNALPATNALADIQDRINRDRLIARDRLGQSVDARTAARRDLRLASRQEPGVELGAFDASAGARALARDVARNALLGQVAAGNAAARQGQVDLVIKGSVDVNVNGDASGLSDEGIQKAGALGAQQIIAGLRQAQTDSKQAASKRLAGAT